MNVVTIRNIYCGRLKKKKQQSQYFVSHSIKMWSLFLHHLDWIWLCAFLWPKQCSRVILCEFQWLGFKRPCSLYFQALGALRPPCEQVSASLLKNEATWNRTGAFHLRVSQPAPLAKPAAHCRCWNEPQPRSVEPDPLSQNCPDEIR